MVRVDVSVIVTVLNERESIRRLLDSLAAQTRRADQVVICDGGSTDGTVDAIHDAVAAHRGRLGDVVVLVLPGANISRGRNAAIERARGPLIAATDAGVRLADNWLEELTAPWASTLPGEPAPLAAGGFFLPDARVRFREGDGGDGAARPGGRGPVELFAQ